MNGFDAAATKVHVFLLLPHPEQRSESDNELVRINGIKDL